MGHAANRTGEDRHLIVGQEVVRSCLILFALSVYPTSTRQIALAGRRHSRAHG